VCIQLRRVEGVKLNQTEFGRAWLALGSVFGLHVVDEATHQFLDWYNPIATRIREKLGGFPFPPSFTFWPWLLGLAFITAAFLSLTPLAFLGRPWLRPVAIAFAAINVFNGLLHLVAAAVMRRPNPGVLSAPILLVASAWLLYVATHLTTR
jgi:hypothetical protein